MPLDFIESERKQRLLLHEGYLFVKEKDGSDGKTIWKCCEYKKIKCPVRIHTLEDEIIHTGNLHNHAADAAKIGARKVVNELKVDSVTTHLATQQLLANSSVGISCAIAGQLPSTACMKRTIQRARARQNVAPPNPVTLGDMVIPDEFKTTCNGEDFLLYDSGRIAGDRRILLFSTRRNLDLLAECPHWYADGTFSTAPALFGQLYTIHGVRFNNVLPSVFALLPNKTEATYIEMLQALKSLKDGLQPTSIMTDFELAAINAFKNEFPLATARGCFFHHCQCIYRNVQSVGLKRRYDQDADFALHLRMLSALAYVPPNDIVQSFEQLTEDSSFPAEAQALVDYFEDVWIGRPQRWGRRRSPTYPIELWNCYNSINEGLPKTNNSVEGWHRRFLQLIGAHHPSLWKFINALQKEQSTNELMIEQYLAGQDPPAGRKKYRDCAKRITKIVEDYNERDLFDYLRGLAHNIEF